MLLVIAGTAGIVQDLRVEAFIAAVADCDLPLNLPQEHNLSSNMAASSHAVEDRV